MISDEIEAFGDKYSYAGKLKPKNLSKKLLVFKNPEYSFQTNIHFSKNLKYSFKKALLNSRIGS